jgi:cadmium resistance protein CadD (predicted permease)
MVRHGGWLVSPHRITVAVQRWGQWIVPVVFIIIGLWIFHKAGVLGL